MWGSAQLAFCLILQGCRQTGFIEKYKSSSFSMKSTHDVVK